MIKYKGKFSESKRLILCGGIVNGIIANAGVDCCSILHSFVFGIEKYKTIVNIAVETNMRVPVIAISFFFLLKSQDDRAMLS